MLFKLQGQWLARDRQRESAPDQSFKEEYPRPRAEGQTEAGTVKAELPHTDGLQAGVPAAERLLWDSRPAVGNASVPQILYL